MLRPPLESTLIVFAGVVPATDFWQIITSNILVKGAITLISIPWIYWVRKGRGGRRGEVIGSPPRVLDRWRVPWRRLTGTRRSPSR